MDKIRICFIGCGDHANRFVYPSLGEAKGVELSAVCSLDMEQAELNCKKHGANKAYSNYREMIKSESPDAVIIVGPPRLHYEAGVYCLERGIPFYIEKPPGENMSQAEELARISAATGVFGQVGFMMRHSAVLKKAEEIAGAERLGDLKYGTVKYFTSGPYRSDEIYGMPGTDDLSYLWRYLMVQAVHPVNLAASFLGEIEEVVPDIVFSGENILVDIKLKDKAGRRFNVLLHTFVAPGYGNLQFSTELFYENRGMIFTKDFSELNFFPPRPKTDYLESGNGNSLHWQFATFGSNNIKMGYQTEIASFIDSVRSGVRPQTDLADGVNTMKILDTVYNIYKRESAEECSFGSAQNSIKATLAAT